MMSYISEYYLYPGELKLVFLPEFISGLEYNIQADFDHLFTTRCKI